MDLTQILGWIGNGIYASMAAVAIYGVFTAILIARRITQKRFRSHAGAEEFLDEVRDSLDKQQYEGVADLCDTPAYWAKAVPQLLLVAVANRNRPVNKVRRLMGEHFEREILADLEYRMSWINTVVKTAPMLGLLGTVTGMIAAFGKIAGASKTGADPSALAGDISFALFTTAMGLMIAVPLVMLGAWLQVRIGKLQDEVQQYLGVFLEDLENAVMKAGRR
ncbi:MAG: MotA/TolQ/ExbB proton channel family protein [Planctomycetota bacterium]|jgi:biopolymer transport protein ExbB/TolQ